LAVYPVTDSLWHVPNQADHGDDMLLSVYFALGIFLLLAVRNPSANRSLIAFTAWSSFAHAAVMATLAIQNTAERGGFLVAVAVLVIIGVALIVLSSGKTVRRAGIGSRCSERSLSRILIDPRGREAPGPRIIPGADILAIFRNRSS
jgi:hypothetical protein